MKLILTETQYKRLLTEDDKSFLEGTVDFKNIGNKVDKFIANLFRNLSKNLKGGEKIETVAHYIESTGLTNDESILLAYNWGILNKTVGENRDYDSLIGEPLEFYGKMKVNLPFYYQGYISGTVDGVHSAYASSVDEFIEKVKDGQYDSNVINPNESIDYNSGSIHWEVDRDYMGDSIPDLVAITDGIEHEVYI